MNILVHKKSGGMEKFRFAVCELRSVDKSAELKGKVILYVSSMKSI